MIVNKRKLKILIERLLKEQTVERAESTTPQEEISRLITIITPFSPTSILKKIIQATDQINNSKEKQISFLLKEMFSGSKQTKAIFGPLLLFSAIFNGYMYLPRLIERSVEQLNTVEGLLEELRHLYRRPLELRDIAEKPGATLITENRWGRDKIVTYIASIMEIPEGRELFGKLTASEYRDLRGFRQQGPILAQSFVNAIQKKRKTIKEEAAKSVKEKLIEKIKSGDVPEEKVRELADLLSQTS
jgi:hypothetical protein